LLIGIERERSARREQHQAFGVRTFALIAVVGTLAREIDLGVVLVALVVLGGLLLVSYLRTSADDAGTTTEVAALATFLLGVLCYRDAPLAAGLAIVMTVLLMSKTKIHSFVRDVLTQAEIEDGLKFLVIALVVLPLMPNRSMGPYGVLNPSRIWLIVVVLTGISWVGYVAVRVLGTRRGLVTTGLASGFVSATATTASMGRVSRTPANFSAAVAGAQVSSVATFVQLEVMTMIVNTRVATRLLVPVVIGSLSLLSVAVMNFRRDRRDVDPSKSSSSSLQQSSSGQRVSTLLPAALLAMILTGALLLARWGSAVLGAKGAVIAVGITGLADAHGGALSAVTLFSKGALGLDTTLFSIAAALFANSVVKSIVAFGSGGRRFGVKFVLGLGPSVLIFLGALLGVILLR
jgi:uncharacterized membrane protein (DUF4010 family)